MKTKLFIILAVSLFFTNLSYAQQNASSSGGGAYRPWLLSQGAAAREAKRFTLQEWLENKDRRALMDMWLSINTPSPYEFVISTALQNYSLGTQVNGLPATEQSKSTYQSEIMAYARFVGVTLEHQNNNEEGFNDVTGIFNLRLFGETIQGTHLTLHYGLRTRTANDGTYRLNQSFPAVTFQLYLMKYFGLQTNYRSFAPVTEAVFGDTSSNEITYGLFIEYGALRIFGDVFQENQTSTPSGIKTDFKRDGARIGLKLFF